MAKETEERFKYPWIGFVDIETTGSKRDSNYLLEVGLVLVRTEDLKVADYETAIIRPDHEHWIASMNGYVYNMHSKNGLVEEVQRIGVDKEEAEVYLVDKVLSYHDIKPHDIIMAGSGVGHFDKPWLEKDMPRFHNHFAYPVLDVGVFRRMAQLAGVPEDKMYREAGHKTQQLNHRAVDDAIDHYHEMLHYLELLKEL